MNTLRILSFYIIKNILPKKEKNYTVLKKNQLTNAAYLLYNLVCVTVIMQM